MWLLLHNTLTAAQIIVGALLSVLLLLAALPLRPVQPRLRRLHLAVGLALRVLIDIIRSNIGVGRVILGLTNRRQIHSSFLEIPLELRDPHGLAVLALIITSTPGTVWADFSAESGILKIHVLDLVDKNYWMRTIKNRYERPLVEIFQ